MPHAYEGYLENGRLYSTVPLTNFEGRRRVIITVLDEMVDKNPDSWAEFDKHISEMEEKPRFEDFPRLQFGRELIDFDEV